MTADSETRLPALPESGSTAPRWRWETIIWPHWLPVRARLPLIAQIAGAAALVAAIAMPGSALVTKAPAPVPASTVAESPGRPAHLNLDVRHAFRSVDLSISVDDKRVFDTKLAGNGKRFGVFGRRAEKAYTKSLNLSPGVRVVRVRVRSAPDKFDQTRVERFDLEPASVAGMQISADRSGLSVIAQGPRASQRAPAPQVTPAPQGTPAAQVMPAAQPQASVLAELYQTLRSVLIAVASVVASAATGVFVQEFLRSRKGHA